MDPRRRADVVGALAPRPGRRRSATSPSRSQSKQFADGKDPVLRRRARRRSRCPSTTATESSSTSPPSTSASHGDTATLRALLAGGSRGPWPQSTRFGGWSAGRPNTRRPNKRAFYGLLPESISHEGYSDKPVHSYWDDAFARKGLADAVELALSLGHPDDARSSAAIRDEFEADLLASIAPPRSTTESSRLHPCLGRTGMTSTRPRPRPPSRRVDSRESCHRPSWRARSIGTWPRRGSGATGRARATPTRRTSCGRSARS